MLLQTNRRHVRSHDLTSHFYWVLEQIKSNHFGSWNYDKLENAIHVNISIFFVREGHELLVYLRLVVSIRNEISWNLQSRINFDYIYFYHLDMCGESK